MTDLELDQQDRAAEAAARELARRLRPITTLRDPDAAAADFVAWLRREHWRCLPPPPPPVVVGRAPGDPPNDDYRTARRALNNQENQ